MFLFDLFLAHDAQQAVLRHLDLADISVSPTPTSASDKRPDPCACASAAACSGLASTVTFFATRTFSDRSISAILIDRDDAQLRFDQLGE